MERSNLKRIVLKNPMILPFELRAIFLMIMLSFSMTLLGSDLPKIETYKGNLVIFREAEEDGISKPLLIQDNERLHKKVYFIDSGKMIHDLPGCSRVVYSKYGKYHGILRGDPSKHCYDTFYTLSIYEGGDLLTQLDWEIFLSEESQCSYFVPLYINEKENSIIVFSESNVLSKYSFDGDKIFDYSLNRGSCFQIRSHFYADEDFLFLTFTDHIEVIDPAGNLRWTKDGDFLPTVKRAFKAGASFIYDSALHSGFNVGDNGVTNYEFSFLISDDVVILPNHQALKGFKLIDLRDNRVIKRLSSLIDKEYREVNTFTASKNGDYFGSFARRTQISSTIENYMIKIVSRENEVVAEYVFDLPAPIEYVNFTNFQISNDGKSFSLVQGDTDSSIYILTFSTD